MLLKPLIVWTGVSSASDDCVRPCPPSAKRGLLGLRVNSTISAVAGSLSTKSRRISAFCQTVVQPVELVGRVVFDENPPFFSPSRLDPDLRSQGLLKGFFSRPDVGVGSRRGRIDRFDMLRMPLDPGLRLADGETALGDDACAYLLGLRSRQRSECLRVAHGQRSLLDHFLHARR